MTGRSKRVVDRVENVLELLQGRPLSTPYSAPYRVVRQQRTYAIRHYGEEGAFEPGSRPPVLFIQPLMVTSEVFDIDPAISGVQALMNQGIDVWLTDFGAPETQEGGMQRTMRDHVLAVSETIDEIVAQTDRDVHLIGYSQGGMFAYETAKGFCARMTGGGFRAIGLPIDDVIDLVVENRLTRGGFVIDRKAVSFAH